MAQLSSPSNHIGPEDLDRNSAMKLLFHHAHIEPSKDDYNLGQTIVTALGHHALAISTAGGYIQASATCGLSNYLPQQITTRTEDSRHLSRFDTPTDRVKDHLVFGIVLPEAAGYECMEWSGMPSFCSDNSVPDPRQAILN
ncbi:hypothetical protein GYMLUDRAFT_250069 [Collybiopsis luxurians FD-317 M1]|uniref:Uncharacterized protein n=1 Tax=Collybiopsis luxurians FD-317 M1 TaxID=944289 RepID=A0A0D0BVP1_9AGAR|nr:hypothetical protein GYMLUDRAFT_250069 [Collybiopsis luxurians FD-317 M1]